MSTYSPRPRPTPAGGVLVAGTTSDAGKSFVATGLCRLLERRGWKVRPFKAANMSLNSIPSSEGGEIALAQWVQCRAARVPPSTRSNPLLMKTEGPGRVEIIVRGTARFRLRSWRNGMRRHLPRLRSEVLRALRDARSDGSFLVAEGAGSPAEVNLRSTDLSNFFVARAADLPVLLVADLERGGALAQVVGTIALLPPADRRRVRGIILNRMRGDPSLLDSARAMLARRTGIPVVGILPFLDPNVAQLPPEDSLQLPRGTRRVGGSSSERRGDPSLPCVGLLRLPHTSNFSDFSGLRPSNGVDARWLERPEELDGAQALILPGTRRTRDDLEWMSRTGWTRKVKLARSSGLRVGGVCGGYQMLGEWLEDPHGFEGPAGTTPGLGLLPIRTRFGVPKLVRTVEARALRGHPWAPVGSVWTGYEIRRGRSTGPRSLRGLFRIEVARGDSRPGARSRDPARDGARSGDGSVWGTALHGLFTSPAAARGLGDWAATPRGVRPRSSSTPVDPTPVAEFPDLDHDIDCVADLLEHHLDLRRVASILGRPLAPAQESRHRGTGIGR